MQIKFFKIKKSFRKENFKINPDTYWKFILSMAFAIMILSFVFGFYLFRQINKKSILPMGSISGQIEIIKKERIDKVLEYFSKRKKKSIEILNSPSPIIDPSL